MTELDRVPWLEGVHVGGRWHRTASFRARERSIREMEDAVAALRREAVEAVVRQGELRSQLAAFKERTGPVEREAAWALERGEERAAFQVLYRELAMLGRRDLLELELVEMQRRAIRLLKDAARLDDRARRARRAES